MTLYNDLASVAAGLMREFKQGEIHLGIRWVLPSETAEAWDVGDKLTRLVEINATVTGAPRMYQDGTLITAADLMVTCPAVDADGEAIDPKLIDHVLIAGVKHVVKEVKPVPPAGDAVVFKLLVGK